MIYGVGIDIENHARFKKYTDSSFNPEHLALIFSNRELRDYAAANNYLYYALSFSCKEAFYKAFGSSEVLLNEIELIFNDTNDFKSLEIFFSGKAKAIIQREKLNIIHSYSVVNENVIFEAILECQTK